MNSQMQDEKKKQNKTFSSIVLFTIIKSAITVYLPLRLFYLFITYVSKKEVSEDWIPVILSLTLVCTVSISIKKLKKVLLVNNVSRFASKKAVSEILLSSLIIASVFIGTMDNNIIKVSSALLVSMAAWTICSILGAIKLIEAEDSEDLKNKTNTELIKSSTEKYAELRELRSLLNDGILDKEEFDLKKKELLGL